MVPPKVLFLEYVLSISYNKLFGEQKLVTKILYVALKKVFYRSNKFPPTLEQMFHPIFFG